MADLRGEVQDRSGAELEDWLARVAEDWRSAGLEPHEQALCAFAEKLTRTPGAMTAEDLEALRAHGLDERALHDAIQVIAYFNYINRVADAVHVDLEPGMPPYPP